MESHQTQKGVAQPLYPHIEPFDQCVVDVGDGHLVYVEQCGNPRGQPVVVLHGGPGGGCSPAMRRYFDPSWYRIILFDQRGCGRSRPHASVEANTTWHLVRDIELIRERLKIDDWYVFGGSWGATLALIYAQSHPDRVRYLALRGVFLMMQRELDWFYGGGAGQFWPELWAEFVAMIPEAERDDYIAAYHRRLFCGDREVEARYARMWSRWENTLASIETVAIPTGDGPTEYFRAFARLENHFFVHKGWLDRDDQLLADIGRIAHIPGDIVQGRYDLICPPASAYALHRAWPKSRLYMAPKAGHALSELAITTKLVTLMDARRG